MADVIAKVETLDDSSDEPGHGAVEYRDAGRTFGPGASLELVDLVAGLAAEQLDDVVSLASKDVHGEVSGGFGDAPRSVLDRDRHEESRRVDARLGGESNDAAGALATGRRRDDVERRVGPGHQVADRIAHRDAAPRSRITIERAATS